MSVYKFSVVIERDVDGYFALCPELESQTIHLGASSILAEIGIVPLKKTD